MASARTSHLPINRERTQPQSRPPRWANLGWHSRAHNHGHDPQKQTRRPAGHSQPSRAAHSLPGPATTRPAPSGRRVGARRPRGLAPHGPRPGRGPGSPVLRGPAGEVSVASAQRVSTGPVPGTFDPVEQRCQVLHLPGSRGDDARGREAGHRATLSPQLGQSGLAPQRPARPLEAGCPHGGSACSKGKTSWESFLRSESRSILHFSRPFLYVHAPTQLNEGFKGKDNFIN